MYPTGESIYTTLGINSYVQYLAYMTLKDEMEFIMTLKDQIAFSVCPQVNHK